MTRPAKKLPSARQGVFLVILGLVCAYLFAAPGEPLLGFGGSIAYLVGVLAGFFVGGMASRSLFAGKRKGLGVALGVALVALLVWWRATGHTDAIFHLNIPHGSSLVTGCFLGYLFGSLNTKRARADQADQSESSPSSP